MNFDRLSRAVATWSGKPAVFFTAVALVVVWAITGPLAHFSSGWQLLINTSTTIITFLMVFVIQAAQNRDTAALHAKLDALIAASDANDDLQHIEDRTLDEIEETRP